MDDVQSVNQSGPSVCVQVTLTRDRFLAVSRYAVNSLFGFRILRWFSVLGLLAFAFILFVPLGGTSDIESRLVLGIGTLFLPFLVLVFVPLLTTFAGRRRWNTAAELREPRNYDFTESRITVTASSSSGSTSWSTIAKAEEVGDRFLLATFQRLFYVIPLRSFAKDSDITAFRELVRLDSRTLTNP